MANIINLRIEKLASTGSRGRIDMYYTYKPTGEYVAFGQEMQKLTKDQVEKERIPTFFYDFPVKQKFKDVTFDLEDPKQKAFYDKLCQNPFVETPINNNLVMKTYRLIDVNEKENEEVKKTKKICDAIQYVRDLVIPSQYGVAYYLGFDFSKLKPSQLFLALVGIENGVLHKGNNWERVMGMETDPLAKLKLYISKAIIGNIISKQGDIYLYKNIPVGSNKDEILFYFQTNSAMFDNGLVFDVNKWDSENPIEVTNEENEGKAKKLDFQNHETKRHLTEETDHEELYKYAQIHSSSFIGHKNWNIETLRTRVNAHKDREAAKAETLRKKTEAAEAK